MPARVDVILKPAILAPQGRTIETASHSLGYAGVPVRVIERMRGATLPVRDVERTLVVVSIDEAERPWASVIAPRLVRRVA